MGATTCEMNARDNCFWEKDEAMRCVIDADANRHGHGSDECCRVVMNDRRVSRMVFLRRVPLLVQHRRLIWRVDCSVLVMV